MHAELAMGAVAAPPANVGDVLASIRRLIALEGTEPQEAANDPLILSPDQQVALAPAVEDVAPAEAVLSPEEEAEIAEAEAALARMLAPPRQPDPPQATAADSHDQTQGAEVVNLFLEQDGEMDAAGLQSLIRDALRHELQGEMGARFSRNLQGLIRREVEAVIREICAER